MPLSYYLDSFCKTGYGLLFCGAMMLPNVSMGSEIDRIISLGTASTSGVYHPVGAGICDLVNESQSDHRLQCTATPTDGSFHNIQAVVAAELDLAITRADLLYKAYQSSDIVNKQLRTITVMYNMPVGVIVKRDSGITKFEDIVGKRVNIGNLGSGRRSIVKMLFRVMGWSKKDFKQTFNFSTKAMEDAFCNDKLDVLIQAVGIPSSFYDKIINVCDGKFIGFSQHVLASIKAHQPFFKDTLIPAGLYSSNREAIKTFGVDVVLFTSNRITDDVIYRVITAIYSKLEKFRQKHPTLAAATPKDIIKNKEFVPLHDDVARYYKSTVKID